ncbi:MAG: hypothetical protein V2A65_07990 [Candidatus Omnitrophota bacterium]
MGDFLNFLTRIKNPLILVLTVFFIMLFILLHLALRKNRRNNIFFTNKFDELYLKIKEDINFAVTPKFVSLSSDMNDLVELTVEVWRIEQRIIKSLPALSENQRNGLENSIRRLRRYLEKHDIMIVDHTNQKFNDGLNLDVLSVEKDSSLTEPIIKETIEPTIMYKGLVVRKAKIILLSK